MPRFKFLLIVIMLGALSCHSQKKVSVVADFKSFANEINLQEQKLFKVADIMPEGLELLRDSLLLIRNTPGANTHFTVMSIGQRKIVTSLLPAGRKENQSLGFLSYGIYNNKLWVADIVKEKIILLDLNHSLDTKETATYKTPFYYSTAMASDSTIICSGDYESDFKISVVNLLSGKVVSQMVPYKYDDANGPVPREQKMAYESFLFLKPSGDQAVLACRYADQIEIVDLLTRTSKIIKGPEGFEPDVITAIGNDEKKISTRNEKTRYAFVKGKTTNDFIYLLYSGNNHLSKHSFYGNCLYVYSWDGTPVAKLNFQSDVVDFAVSNENKMIYAYHPGSKFITVSNHFIDEKK